MQVSRFHVVIHLGPQKWDKCKWCFELKSLGYRSLVLIGGLMATVCLIVSSYLENMLALTIVYGALMGLSLGMIILPSMLSVNMYF